MRCALACMTDAFEVVVSFNRNKNTATNMSRVQMSTNMNSVYLKGYYSLICTSFIFFHLPLNDKTIKNYLKPLFETDGNLFLLNNTSTKTIL